MNPELAIDTLDHAYYTVAHGDGQTKVAREADVKAGGQPGPAASAAHPFYTRLNQMLDEHDFDGYVGFSRHGVDARFGDERVRTPRFSGARRPASPMAVGFRLAP